MKRTASKSSLLGLSMVAVASFGSILTACSSPSQSQSTAPQPQSSSSSATNTGDKPMAHGSMNHGSMSGMDHHSALNLGPADKDYDLRFIDTLLFHHGGAIKLGEEAEQKSKRPEIKKLARNVIVAQSRENKLLQEWRQAWYPKAGDTPVAYNSETGKTLPISAEQKSDVAMKENLGSADAEFDLRFMNALIPHHEDPLVIAKDALSKSRRPEVKQLANEIIASQQAEIDQMKQWRKAWYNQ